MNPSLVSLGPLAARIVDVGLAPADSPELTVVLLHGYGAPGDDLAGLAPALRVPPGTRLVFPEGRLALSGMLAGGRAWWPLDMARIERALAMGDHAMLREVPDGLAESRDALHGLLDALERSHGARPSRTVLGGFSQGAMLSLDFALREMRELAGLVVLSGSIICADEWPALFQRGARRGTRVLMSHGTEDPLLLFSIAEVLRDWMKDAGMLVEWVPFEGGHGIGLEVVRALGPFLSSVLNVTAP